MKEKTRDALHLLHKNIVSGEVVRREQPAELSNGRLEHADFPGVVEAEVLLHPVPRPPKLILHAHQPQGVFSKEFQQWHYLHPERGEGKGRGRVF